MTFQELITDVRAFLIDVGAVQELTDELYAQFATAGMRFIWDACPQSRLDATGRALNTWAAADASAPSTALCINDGYYHALMDYMMYRYYDRDSGDSRDKVQARYYWDQFSRTLDLGR